jgi:hypothetical protein
VLANPRVGAAMPATVAEIDRRGHEVGLHGGRSHRLWQDDAGDWSHSKVASEIGWGLGRLAAAGVPEPAGFSSPGWNGSPLVARVAADHGFRYLADDHGHGPATVARGPEGLVRVSTNLVDEPGGVGYLEWHRALGDDDDDILRDVAGRLADSGDLAVLYDHPFYAGIFEATCWAGSSSRRGRPVGSSTRSATWRRGRPDPPWPCRWRAGQLPSTTSRRSFTRLAGLPAIRLKAGNLPSTTTAWGATIEWSPMVQL